MDETGSGLPPGVALLWGLRDRSRRGGPKPGLSLDRIVAAAVELADTGGLAALSMSRLAEKLGFTTMSLYRYVTSKDELLLLAMNAAIGPPAAVDPDGDWRVELERWARANLAIFRAHPWMLQVPITGPPIMPNQLRYMDRGLAAMARTRLTEDEKASAILLLALYARDQAQLAVGLAEGERAAREAGVTIPSYGRLVGGLIDADGFPALSRAIEAGAFDDTEDDVEAEFDFGLQRVLDGIEALVGSRAPRPRTRPSREGRSGRPGAGRPDRP
jgi:AcrR family transcriptional regulator